MGPLHTQPSHCSRDQGSASVRPWSQHGVFTTPANQCALRKHKQGRQHPHVIQQQTCYRCHPILFTVYCPWRTSSRTFPCTGPPISHATIHPSGHFDSRMVPDALPQTTRTSLHGAKYVWVYNLMCPFCKTPIALIAKTSVVLACR